MHLPENIAAYLAGYTSKFVFFSDFESKLSPTNADDKQALYFDICQMS